MKNYTKKEAAFLIDYYTPLMKDRYLDDSKQLKVVNIREKLNPDGTCTVQVMPQRMQSVVQFFREIGDAAIYFNLESPENVLARRS